MKKWMLCAALTACVGMHGGNVFAEDAQPAESETTQREYQTDPTLTNRTADYPSIAEALPSRPVPPAGGLSDANGFLAYQQAVDEYIKAAQKYVDGATNDANDIIRKRNEAVKSANDAVAEYNSFLDKNAKKS